MNRIKTVLGVSIAALIAFGGVLSVADVGQAGERDRKGDREWRDEGDWKGEWKRDETTTMIATMIGGGGAATAEDIGAATAGLLGWVRTALMVIIADRDTTVAGAAGCIGTH